MILHFIFLLIFPTGIVLAVRQPGFLRQIGEPVDPPGHHQHPQNPQPAEYRLQKKVGVPPLHARFLPEPVHVTRRRRGEPPHQIHDHAGGPGAPQIGGGVEQGHVGPPDGGIDPAGEEGHLCVEPHAVHDRLQGGGQDQHGQEGGGPGAPGPLAGPEEQQQGDVEEGHGGDAHRQGVEELAQGPVLPVSGGEDRDEDSEGEDQGGGEEGRGLAGKSKLHRLERFDVVSEGDGEAPGEEDQEEPSDSGELADFPEAAVGLSQADGGGVEFRVVVV
mmetsp:Transcript_6508/g.14064  ORF Transcript_6508/g.14064 Transcript_6508/m.14064 type:complete len:274 (+) Transcript_6508:42-863(+)